MNRLAHAARLALYVLATVACSAHAADPLPPSNVPSIGLLQVAFALAVVLAAIVVFGWLLRRWMPGHSSAGGLLRVVAGVMVGPKERLVLVELGDTWLLLGVATSSVSLLHSMPKPQVDPSVAPSAAGVGFARVLKQALSGRRSP
jgi:flagellar protein FliO/FliZ